MPDSPQPSDLELQILGVLWRDGPLTARQVLQSMPDGKARAYTSILSVMQVMEKKGLLTHTAAGNAHVYRPAVTRSRVLRPFLRRLVQHVFGGEPAAAVQQLLQETEIGAEDVAQIRQVLDQITPSRRASGKERQP